MPHTYENQLRATFRDIINAIAQERAIHSGTMSQTSEWRGHTVVRTGFALCGG